MLEQGNGTSGVNPNPTLDLPGPSKPIRVEPVEEPGRRPIEVPEEPGHEPDVSPEREREPAEVPG